MIVNKSKHAIDLMREFLRLESASGTLLIVATILALIMANIPSALHAYDWFLGLHLTITVGGLGVDKPLLRGRRGPVIKTGPGHPAHHGGVRRTGIACRYILVDKR
jgi:hypothetical protein